MRRTKEGGTPNLPLNPPLLGEVFNLHNNVCWPVGDGQIIRLGNDSCVSGIPDFIPRLNPRFALWASKSVSSLFLPNSSRNVSSIKEMFIPSDDAEKILRSG